MRNVLFIFVLLWKGIAICQTEKIKIKIEKEEEQDTERFIKGRTSLELVYGQKVFAKNFYKQLNTFDNIEFSLPLKVAGFGFSGNDFPVNRSGMIALYMNYLWIMPQNIKVQDTLSSKIKGFIYSFGWGKGISSETGVLGLAFYIGFNTGYTKITNDILGKQVNPFFSPKFSLQPKLVIAKYLAISFIIDCDYDVTNPIWRSFRSAEQSKTLNPFHQTGLSFNAAIGYVFY